MTNRGAVRRSCAMGAVLGLVLVACVSEEAPVDTIASAECESTAECTLILCPCSWTAVAKSDAARLEECAQMQRLARCTRPGHRPELRCVGGSCTTE